MNPQTQVLLIFPMLFALIFTLVAGQIIGNKITRKTATYIGLGLAAMTTFSIFHFLVPMFASHHFQNFVLPIMGVFGPVYFGMGILFGRGRRTSIEGFEKALTGWQKQLAADRSSGASPFIIVQDLEKIADISANRLAKHDEALKALDQAYAIVRENYPTHPSAASFYWSYAAALRNAKRKADAQRVQAEADALPKDLLQ